MIKNKVDYYFDVDLTFRKASKYLSNGCYFVDDTFFYKKRFSLKKVFKYHFVFSHHKRSSMVKGKIFLTKYKRGVLFEDFTHFFWKSKKRYDSFKRRYDDCIGNCTNYPFIPLVFNVYKKEVSSPIVKGKNYYDELHHKLFLKTILEISLEASYKTVEENIFGNKICMPWYVQHGDCKPTNIFWNNNSIVLIDLEEIDYYPPLYDFFYYLFFVYQNSCNYLFSNGFVRDSVLSFCKATGIKFDSSYDIVDIFVASYAYYTVKKVRPKTDLFEYEFYLFWRKFFQRERFPLTDMVLNQYEKRIGELNLK